MRNTEITIYFLLLTLVVAGCENGNQKVNYQPEYKVDTIRKREILLGLPYLSGLEILNPFVKAVNNRLKDRKLQLVPCINYADYLQKARRQYFDVSMIGGIFALDCEKYGYKIVGKMSDDSINRAIIITRRNNQYNTPKDLSGATISIAGSDTTVAGMMGLYYLYEHGLNINKDIHKVYSPSFESAIMSVYLGKADAVISLQMNWNNYQQEYPDKIPALTAKWKTPWQPNPAIIVNSKMDPTDANELIQIIMDLGNTEDGRNALSHMGIHSFEKANTDTYRSLQEFKKKFMAIYGD